MSDIENNSPEKEGSSVLNEVVFGLYEDELGVVNAIEAIKALDISKQKTDTSSKIEQLKHLIEVLKDAEQEILLALFQKESVTSKKIPLSRKNIQVLEPILEKMGILLVYRNEKDQDFLNDIAPILMGKSDGSGYFLKIDIDKNQAGDKYIKTIKIMKEEEPRKNVETDDEEEDEPLA